MNVTWSRSKMGCMSFGKEESDRSRSCFSQDGPLPIDKRTSQSVPMTCLPKLETVHNWGFSSKIRVWWLGNWEIGSCIDENWFWVIADMFWGLRRPADSTDPFFPFLFIYIQTKFLFRRKYFITRALSIFSHAKLWSQARLKLDMIDVLDFAKHPFLLWLFWKFPWIITNVDSISFWFFLSFDLWYSNYLNSHFSLTCLPNCLSRHWQPLPFFLTNVQTDWWIIALRCRYNFPSSPVIERQTTILFFFWHVHMLNSLGFLEYLIFCNFILFFFFFTHFLCLFYSLFYCFCFLLVSAH